MMKHTNRPIYYLMMILITGSLISCNSQVDVQLINNEIPVTGSLLLSKENTDTAQEVESLNLVVGETINLYSMSSDKKGSYLNVPVNWSLNNSIGTLNVTHNGQKAEIAALNVGTGIIQIEIGGVQKRISLTITATNDNSPVSSNINPPSFDQDTQEIITLSYSDIDGDHANACNITNLSNITETQSCTCSAGTCTVGVTGTAAYSGVASFDFTVTANSAVSNTSTATLTIDSTGLLCPTGFVAVDGNGILGTTDFCVMQFEAKDNAGTPVSQPSGAPWGNITPTTAQSKCASITEGGFSGTFSLISNPEWMTIARDIENYAPNWSGGSVGSGHIPKGHSDNSPSSFLAVTDTSDPYNGTGNNSGQAPGSGWEQRRTHTLSNGSVIWDFSGNIYEWTDWDDGSAGFTTGPTNEAMGRKELSINPTGSLTADDYKPDNDTYNSANNSFGVWYGGGGGAALRGGSFSMSDSGIYMLNLYPSPSATYGGFRCVYRP